MREIKFRGKDMETLKWVYGNFCNACGNEHGAMCIDCFVVDPATVGQYTGLKDKNDVEIYEGDVLSDARGRLYVIVWRAGGACVYSADEYRDMRRKVPVTLHDALADRQVSNYVQEGLTVVGNIHDAPEMLK